MKQQSQKMLSDVRKALSGRQILAPQAYQGGGRPAQEPPRWAFPFVVDTDRP